MRSGIRDDNEGSDDRLKYKEDRQATGSWGGQRKNAHTYTSLTSLGWAIFPLLPNLVETSAQAQGRYIHKYMHRPAAV